MGKIYKGIIQTICKIILLISKTISYFFNEQPILLLLSFVALVHFLATEPLEYLNFKQIIVYTIRNTVFIILKTYEISTQFLTKLQSNPIILLIFITLVVSITMEVYDFWDKQKKKEIDFQYYRSIVAGAIKAKEEENRKRAQELKEIAYKEMINSSVRNAKLSVEEKYKIKSEERQRAFKEKQKELREKHQRYYNERQKAYEQAKQEYIRRQYFAKISNV